MINLRGVKDVSKGKKSELNKQEVNIGTKRTPACDNQEKHAKNRKNAE
ncbi:hypothetical protein CPJCM30710_05370 [Clostridium polyendosporum]|uniref:Uncharacterized protein n=1 Tax=Clostridium polyendosporum TaxID=69208 RepID=A0A919VFU5_9CLOT|nr:hypothetical protein CPJCM30710_05370 [Clostridium polyendosporum]